ncbi:uncharacterized protein LOC117217841 [Megalopta genalis]|uniref:uncharacterized protein LOC117217841 n=1 Tax=Megalopta genalis TaxID=115081 RepID=UPI003FD1B4FE
MRIYRLLFLVLFIVRSSTESVGKRTVEREEGSANSVKNVSSRKYSKNVTELTWSLKQADNATTTNQSSQVTATRQGPCQCGGGLCGCCSKILYNTWKQKACVNVSYDADEFSFTAKVSMNDRVLYTRTVSGKNPRPICVPVPRLPIVKACIRFYNIYFQGRNVHMCVNMEGKFRETTLFKVGLDCLRFGSNGLALVKPEDGGGIGQVEFLPDDDGAEEDDYDYDDDDDDDDDDDILDL